MGVASKLFVYLNTPFPLTYPQTSSSRVLSLSRKLSFFSSTSPRHPLLHSSIKASSSSDSDKLTHTQTTTTSPSSSNGVFYDSKSTHLWPEWLKLVENLKVSGYFGNMALELRGGDDGLSVFEEMPEEFVQAARACMAFARDRSDILGSLSRKYIETIVENGSPFLFKGAADTARRMKTYLGGDCENELEFEGGDTSDLMRFLLSYAFSPSYISGSSNIGNREVVESSVRSLLSELADVSRMPQFPRRYGETPKPFGQNIEMKRGDWICSKCSFMNFARNMKCIECNQARPKRQLTGGEWECPQCDFFNYGRNVACLRCDCNRPGETSFRRPSPSASGLGSESNLSNFNTTEGSFMARESAISGETSEKSVCQSFDRILNRSSTISETNKRVSVTGDFRTERSFVSEADKSGYVPFVPLPADKFAKPQNSNTEKQATDDKNNKPVTVTGSPDISRDGLLLSEKPVSENESKEDKEQAEKSERWFKKVAELHDVKDLASAISDEDFPEIMPMRKGENRFVVSKKKDRSLTSPLYKRRMAMEQPSTTNFVPFVPFPPDYFAKKDKQAETSTLTDNFKDGPSAPASATLKTKDVTEKIEISKSGNSSSETQQTKRVNPTKSPTALQANSGEDWKGGFSGKSLEGSLVTEPDPLDMSEEAKAQRWFRRAAQIKDISELSQIPDEDFPEIMPMRKGLNRFVVSKRKTPLERRLTSPQYRMNFPIVSSEPVKKENGKS
ncbi:hypothetical protein GIB67_037750 [Kingdonia uniflora]|uniref:RanBP2-type domain-containing protein n=1 Tax=Kingdonia uniflora TaxID=39325 RepID=A0A7J7LV84_9MAGN|nr:hypothetical protein GIB67_037750 [Kingdonia uniflora]